MKRIRQAFAVIGHLLSRPCLAFEALSPHGLKMIWHKLRHGGWAPIQEELAPYLSEAPAPARRKLVPAQSARAGTILVIDRSLPRFDRDAGSRAAWQYIELLLDMGFRVMVRAHDALRREPYASMLEDMGVEVLADRRHACGGWKKWLKANAGDIDAIIMHRPNIAMRYLDEARRLTSAKMLYFGHDLRWLRNARRYEIEKDRFYLSEAAYWKKVEMRLAADMDAVYYFSEEEAMEIRRLNPQAQTRVVPLFLVRPETLAEVPAFDQREGLLFVGGFAHAPNVDGILWFVGQILPLLREALPELSITVVGGNPPAQLQNVPGVVMAGSVSDAELARLYQRSRIALAPLRYGAGIKGKVVEAINHRIPTVTTSIGAEGLPLAASVLDIADAPREFADAVSALYTNAGLWSRRSADLGCYLADHFSPASARRVLEKDLMR
ncbi:MAG: glycosyltransferase family 4 protein [Pseudomonadota bacterium]